MLLGDSLRDHSELSCYDDRCWGWIICGGNLVEFLVVAAIVFLCFLFLVAGTFLFGTIFVTITILALGTFRLFLVVVPGPVFLVFIDLVLGEDLLGPPALPVGSLALVIELGLLLLGIFGPILSIKLGLLQLEGFGPVLAVQLGFHQVSLLFFSGRSFSKEGRQ
jgi:hypothetical protein